MFKVLYRTEFLTRKSGINWGVLILVIATVVKFAVMISHSSGEPNGTDVIILYSSGVPFKTIGQVKANEVDAVTCPTPKHLNCKTVAELLGRVLREKNVEVKVASISEAVGNEDIINARLVVLGSPSRFWNVSWEMKRFLDEQFGRIYVADKKALRGKKVAAFAMAEIEGSANETLNALGRAVTDCGGTFGPTMIVLTRYSEKEIEKGVIEFAGKLQRGY
jgi:flavorubredoxin